MPTNHHAYFFFPHQWAPTFHYDVKECMFFHGVLEIFLKKVSWMKYLSAMHNLHVEKYTIFYVSMMDIIYHSVAMFLYVF